MRLGRFIILSSIVVFFFLLGCERAPLLEDVQTQPLAEFEGQSPQWGMLGGNVFRSNRTAFVGPFQEPVGQILVTRETPLVGSPIIDEEGDSYLGSGTSFARYMVDGQQRWSLDLRGRIESSAALDMFGVCYVGTLEGVLYAIYPDGRVKWQLELEGPVVSSPIVDDQGRIYVATLSGTVYVFYRDGTLRWSYSFGDSIEGDLALGLQGDVYVGVNDSRLYALDSMGSLMWSYEVLDKIRSMPSVSPKGDILFGADDGQLYVLTADGQLKWSYDLESAVVTIPVMDNDGTIYVSSRLGDLVALRDGKLLWTLTGSGFSDVLIDGNNRLFVCSESGDLYALSKEGTVLWRVDLGGRLVSSPVLDQKGRCYVTSWTGQFWVFE